MTRDDARKLMAGYATGALTDAERAALFDAALHDQELFDDLASEQELKEILDEPGARQRLITALEPPPSHRVWLWAMAAATLVIVVGVVVSKRTPQPPRQIAQVLKSPEPAPVPVAPVAPVAPERAPAPVARKISPPSSPPAPKPPAEERAQLADKLETDASARGGGGGGGFAGARTAAAPRAENMAVNTVSGFAFNYAVRADGYLEIVPAARGFLSATAGDAVIFPSGAVNPGSPLRIPIPSGATSLLISFSRTPGITGSPVRREEPTGTVTDQDPPNGRIIIQLFLTPATR